jgi:hypothetical protein
MRVLRMFTLGGLIALLYASSAHALTLGFTDPAFDPLSTAAKRTTALDRATAINSKMVRLAVLWQDVAPATRPAGFEATNPGDPAYRFAPVDAAVRAAAAHGQEVLLLTALAPAWAQGANRPKGVNDGAWKPDAQAYGDFMRALAARFNGTFDPGDGQGILPKVAAFQIWNEPNLTTYLAPQWTKQGKSYKASSPELYRALANAAYPQIKAADPGATVVQAGTAPYGDPDAGGTRMAPARWERYLLCLSGSAAHPKTAPCPDPVHLDAFAHHPYGVGSPTNRSYWPDDVTLAELPRLTREYALATKTGRVLPKAKRKQLWITEFGWESKPDPTGVSQAKQAAWLRDGVKIMKKNGADVALWYRITDDPPVPSWGRSSQAGLFERTGKRKPAASAFASLAAPNR